MQPQNNPQAGFNLPPVAPEQMPPFASQEVGIQAPEVALAAPEFAPNVAGNTPPIIAPILPQMNQIGTVQTTTPVVPSTTMTTTLPTTDDTDLIEKEWVHKAKQIVERTKEDPHLQSKELSGLKADYLQKRYSKEIKLGE